MHKAYFDPVNSESHDAVVRWFGWTLVSNKTFIYSQQIKVIENINADSLSRDFHSSYQTLTKKSNQILPQLTAASFHIKQPPRNVISWISSLASASTLPMASPKPLQPIILATGIGGVHYSNTQESQTNFWWGSHRNRGKSLCHHLHQFIKTRKKILLHGTVKSDISDVSTSFRTHLRSDLNLDLSGQTSLLLQRQLRG